MQRMTAVLLLFLFACAPARTVRINGQDVPYEEAARAEFNVAKASYDQGRYDAAAQQFGLVSLAIGSLQLTIEFFNFNFLFFGLLGASPGP